MNDNNHEPVYFGKIISSTVAATEWYLNTCTDPTIPLAKQGIALRHLNEMARHDCQSKASATQLIDSNFDGKDELVLHAKVLEGEDLSGCPAGVSIVFTQNTDTHMWRGYPVWPIELLEKQPAETPADVFISSVFHPKMYMLDFRDTKGRSYLAIETTFQGGDHTANLLTIVQLDGQYLKSILRLDLKDWCGQPNTWTIGKNGTIVVPEARATDRCATRKKMVYQLEQL